MLKKTPRPNLYDILKFLAIIFMIIDHLGYFLFPKLIIFREIWRWAFPLFLMLIGYNQSSKISSQLWISTIIIQLFLWIITWLWYIDNWQLNILVGIVITKYLMWYISKWSDIKLILLFMISIFLIPYTIDIVEYGTCIMAIGVFVVLIDRWINNLRDVIYTWYKDDLLMVISNVLNILLISIIMLYGFIAVNNRFNFDENGWILVITGWIISIVCIYILSYNNTSIGVLSQRNNIITKNISNLMIYINNNALYVYIIHVILLYIITLLFYYGFK